jgi:hypothetical protein
MERIGARHLPTALWEQTAMNVDSTSDDRTLNNVMRHQYRVLSDAEKAQMQALKDKGLELHELIKSMGTSRELSIAATKTEEAVMWAVKHITK